MQGSTLLGMTRPRASGITFGSGSPKGSQSLSGSSCLQRASGFDPRPQGWSWPLHRQLGFNHRLRAQVSYFSFLSWNRERMHFSVLRGCLSVTMGVLTSYELSYLAWKPWTSHVISLLLNFPIRKMG